MPCLSTMRSTNQTIATTGRPRFAQDLSFISWPQHCGMQWPALMILTSCLHFSQT